jgi:hypothetical protein
MIVFDWIFAQANVAVNKSNREFNAKELAIMYNEWVAEVKENVPNERLLVFACSTRWMETSLPVSFCHHSLTKSRATATPF